MADAAVEKDTPKKRGRPAENKKVYRTVIRLPVDLSEKLKVAAKDHGVSINEAIVTLVELWTADEDPTEDEAKIN